MITPRRKIKTILATITLVFFVFSTTPVANAYWGEAIMGNLMKRMLDTIVEQIRGMLVSALKQAAAEIINSTVNNMVGSGGSDGAMFITDWQEFLVDSPRKKTALHMNDFFSSMYQGKASSSNYATLGSSFFGEQKNGSKKVASLDLSQFSGEGAAGNFYSYLEATGRKAISAAKPKVNSYEYCSDPFAFSKDGSWNWNCYNNTAGVNFETQLLSADELAAIQKIEKKKALTQAIAYQGYKGQGTGDMVSTPGSYIKDINTQAADVGNKALAAATNISEVVAAMVTKVVTKALKQGIGNAKQQIQKKVNEGVNRAQQEINSQIPTQRFKPQY